MNTPIRTIVVDDEALARRGLKIRLKEFPDVELIAECANGREALKSIESLQPDLVFLDIQMPGLDGFDVIKSMQSDDMPMVVFVTAFDQYAVEAFDVRAVDYILKPVEEDRLAQAIEKARANIASKSALSDKQQLLSLIGDITGKTPSDLADAFYSEKHRKGYPDKLYIKDGSDVAIVDMHEIDWIDAAGDYMCVHVGEKIHIMRTTMKQLDEQLDPELFQRVHRSTIVNLSRVKQLCSHINGEYHIVLACGARLKMSRSYKKKISHFQDT
ncbi:MAG: two-component system LytT family response regulator [Flavobacteriales bacterium]|jgi:two-component system LytT family response regulator